MSWVPRRWRLWSTVALVLATVLVGWLLIVTLHDLDKEDPSKGRPKGNPYPVRTALVTESEHEQTIGATALTMPSASVSIRIGQISGFSSIAPISDVVIKTVNVQPGDYVRKGQQILDLDDTVFIEVYKERKAAVAAAKAEVDRVTEEIKYTPKLRELTLASAEAEVKYRTDALDILKKQLEAIQSLYRNKQAATLFDLYQAMSQALQGSFMQAQSVRDLDKAKATLAVGGLRDKELLAKSLASYESARAQLVVFEHDLTRLKVESPLEGYVDYGPNPFTQATSIEPPVPGTVIPLNTTIAQVFQVDPIYVRLDFPQERIDEVAVGQKTEVTLDSFPKEVFHGKVVRILGEVNPTLRILPVDVRVENPHKHRIKGGITGYARVRSLKKGLILPATALLRQGDKSMVFRVENGRARIREVQIGNLADLGFFELRNGLNAGDEVVIYQGFYAHSGDLVSKSAALQDNDPVDTNWRGWAKRE